MKRPVAATMATLLTLGTAAAGPFEDRERDWRNGAVVYQIIVARFVYPGEVVIVALLLAIVPYLLVRGLVTRIARTRQ